ncbi:MAG: response regulator [Desulfomonilaceae bacterium]|nr:response regulator [Desulfomonilaceae bacterium]
MSTHNKILIVESNAFAALDLQRTLHGMGYCAPITAPGGEEALQLIDAGRFSLVLIELELRGALQGKEVAEIIRRRTHIPVIFMTTDAERNLLETMAASNPFACLLKPIPQCLLRSAVTNALKGPGDRMGIHTACSVTGCTNGVACDGRIPTTIDTASTRFSVFGTVGRSVPRSLEAMGYTLDGHWERKRNEGAKDYLEPRFRVRGRCKGLPPALGNGPGRRGARDCSADGPRHPGLKGIGNLES